MADLKIRVGVSRIITITWPSEFSLGDVERYITDFARLLRELEHRPVVVVNDMRAVKLTDAIDRKLVNLVAGFVARERELLGRSVAGWANVTDSWPFRNVLRLVSFKTDSPYAQEIFATVEEAERWAAKILVHGK